MSHPNNTKTPVACVCYTCGETFYRNPSHANRGKRSYCSRECFRLSGPKRFMELVVTTDTCWLFTGGLDNLGYGNFTAGGRQQKAHRYAYELFVAPIPEGLEIDHVWDRGCRYRNCVNPDHLEPVTHLENMRRGEYARKKFCAHGHERNEQNTYQYHNGRKICRICRNAYQNRKRQQQRNHRLGLTVPAEIGSTF